MITWKILKSQDQRKHNECDKKIIVCIECSISESTFYYLSSILCYKRRDWGLGISCGCLDLPRYMEDFSHFSLGPTLDDFFNGNRSNPWHPWHEGFFIIRDHWINYLFFLFQTKAKTTSKRLNNRQWLTLVALGSFHFSSAICISLQAPFYPEEVR